MIAYELYSTRSLCMPSMRSNTLVCRYWCSECMGAENTHTHTRASYIYTSCTFCVGWFVDSVSNDRCAQCFAHFICAFSCVVFLLFLSLFYFSNRTLFTETYILAQCTYVQGDWSPFAVSCNLTACCTQILQIIEKNKNAKNSHKCVKIFLTMDIIFKQLWTICW